MRKRAVAGITVSALILAVIGVIVTFVLVHALRDSTTGKNYDQTLGSNLANVSSNKDGLTILTWNILMFPKFLVPLRIDAESRIKGIIQELIYQGTYNDVDIVVLQEVFADDIYATLLEELKDVFHYRTNVLNAIAGRMSMRISGGVTIFSKLPIVETELEEAKFQRSCGTDKLARKGFMDIVVRKPVTPDANAPGGFEYYRIVGTHLQADDSLCKKNEAAWVRQHQIDEIVHSISRPKLMTAKGFTNVVEASAAAGIHNPVSISIEAKETYFVGDLNIDYYSEEYQYLKTNLLQLRKEDKEPFKYVEQQLQFSFDPKSNSICKKRKEEGLPSMMYDYVIPVSGFRQQTKPDGSMSGTSSSSSERRQQHLLVYRPIAIDGTDLSDHYPVLATPPMRKSLAAKAEM